MPRVKRTNNSLPAAEALTVLKRLAHKGAYAAMPVPADSGSGPAEWHIYSPRNDFAAPLWRTALPAVADGQRKGWFEPGAGDGQLQISAAGFRALRAVKSTAGAESAATAPALGPSKPDRPGPEGALVWLRRRKDKDGRALITEPQFKAGERLAADFWHAQMSPRVTANWSAMAPVHRMRRGTPGFGVDMCDAVVAARRRFQRALEDVGPELATVLVDVCCHDMGLEAFGQAEGWPQRATKVVLDLALTRLARHYGLLPPERPAAARLRHWGDANYRPTLDGWRDEAHN